MLVSLFLVTRNRTVAVRTLHTCLGINSTCAHHKIAFEVTFIEEHETSVIDEITKKMKGDKRLIVLEYGCSIEKEAIHVMFSHIKQHGQVAVFPAPVEGIDWDKFKKKVIADGNTEPISQAGLSFDTVLGKQLSEGMWSVTKTSPRVWVMDTKPVSKKLKDKKGNSIKLPNTREAFFDKLLAQGVKIFASTSYTTSCLFQHECISNILNSHGVSRRTAPVADGQGAGQ